MATNLDGMCFEMKQGLNTLRGLSKSYPNSIAFQEFLADKERDYEEFMKLVGPLSRTTFAPCVVNYLRSVNADKKFLGMTQRTSEYFKVTKKLMKSIEAGL